MLLNSAACALGPAALSRYIAGEASDIIIRAQTPWLTLIVCTSNCSAEVMLPPISMMSGVSGGIWELDSGALAVDPPLIRWIPARWTMAAPVVGFTRKTLFGSPIHFATFGSEMILGVLMYEAR